MQQSNFHKHRPQTYFTKWDYTFKHSLRLDRPQKKQQLFNNKVMTYIKKIFYAIEILILPL